MYNNCLERALALVLLWSEPGLSQRDYLYLSWVGQGRFPLFNKPVFQINEGKIQKRFPLCDTSTRKRRCFQNVNINIFQGVTFLMGKVVIWRETILCANFETKSEKQKKKITRCATFYREMWKLKALKGSSCGVGCYQSHITVKPTARLFVETSNYFKRRYFNCRSLMTGMKHAIHLMKRTLTSEESKNRWGHQVLFCYSSVFLADVSHISCCHIMRLTRGDNTNKQSVICSVYSRRFFYMLFYEGFSQLLYNLYLKWVLIL